MFDHTVLVASNLYNVKLLKSMDLKNGRDFRSEKGAVAAGRPNQLLLKFKDKDKALFFKLKSRNG
jgi:hypothetical protein